jgi:hypothetical protein
MYVSRWLSRSGERLAEFPARCGKWPQMKVRLIFLNLDEPLTAWDCYSCGRRNRCGHAVRCYYCRCGQVVPTASPANRADACEGGSS